MLRSGSAKLLERQKCHSEHAFEAASLSLFTFCMLSEATKFRDYKAFNKITYRAHSDGVNVQSYAETKICQVGGLT
jgi:hypothetical protein